MPLTVFSAKVSLDTVAKGPYRTGQTVEIVYRFEGVGGVKVPPTIDAGGLVFRLVDSSLLPGRSRGELVPDHGRLYFYVAVPDRPGKFVVPKRVWDSAGKTLKSPARTMEVRGPRLAEAAPGVPGKRPDKSIPVGSESDVLKWLQNRAAQLAPPTATASSAPAPSPRAAARNTARPLFASPVVYAGRPVVARTNAYLGEAVPVTWQFFLRADSTFQDLLRPSLDGNGFFADPMEELTPATITNNGVPYYQVTLQTTIVPLRTGPLEIPGATLQGRHSIHESNLNSPTAGWTNFAQPSDPLRLEVAPLPERRPHDFTGGVGKFEALAPQIDPRPSNSGEPVTLRLGVEGRGNLRAMQKPVLDPASTAGWRVYDAGETVERTGADGSGKKYFEFQLIAAQDRDASPGATLSYFDPQEKKFVRLQFPPEPLNEAPPPAAVDAPSPTPRPPAQSARESAYSAWPSLLSFLLEAIRQAAFWPISIIVSTFLLFWAARIFLRRRREGGALLKAALSDAWDRLDEAGDNPAAFYAAAAGVISSRLALWHGKAGALDDIGGQLNRRVANVPLREDLATVLARRDELNYGAEESTSFQPGERDAVCASLEKFCEDVT